MLASALLVVGVGARCTGGGGACVSVGAAPPGAASDARAAPFNPWHFVLAPMALIFALPLLWLLVTSFMTNAQINRFPPTIIPDSLHLDGYRYVFRNGAFPHWF